MEREGFSRAYADASLIAQLKPSRYVSYTFALHERERIVREIPDAARPHRRRLVVALPHRARDAPDAIVLTPPHPERTAAIDVAHGAAQRHDAHVPIPPVERPAVGD